MLKRVIRWLSTRRAQLSPAVGSQWFLRNDIPARFYRYMVVEIRTTTQRGTLLPKEVYVLVQQMPRFNVLTRTSAQAYSVREFHRKFVPVGEAK